MKSIKETIMEIANYIKEQKRKVELIEIIEKFINEKYARLNENDLEIVRMLIKEHNEEYK